MTIRIKKGDRERMREERRAKAIRAERYLLSLETRKPTFSESFYQRQGVSL